jgi:diaminohydroxyphosphoribosylaminopyrimidine deaminase/5-amino-6-(5-phosphoribosylamino)uracil reductase
VHRWRSECDAVAVGIGTALADDPLLTARDVDPPARRQPARVVFDSAARLPVDSELVGSVAEAPLYVACSPDAEPARLDALRAAGAQVIVSEGGREMRIASALSALGEREITSMLLEGGAGLAGSFVAAGEVDELRLFYAPLVLGGGRPLFAGEGAAAIAEGARPEAVEWTRIDDDMLVRARLREW